MSENLPQRPEQHVIGDRAVNVFKFKLDRTWSKNESKSVRKPSSDDALQVIRPTLEKAGEKAFTYSVFESSIRPGDFTKSQGNLNLPKEI